MNTPDLHLPRSLRRRLIVGTGLATAAVAIGVTAATASPTAPAATPAATTTSPATSSKATVTSPTPFIVQDVATGDHLEVVIDPSVPQAGQFIAAIPGLGLVSPTAAATVTVHSAHSVALRYDGAGTLDAKAHLDPEFGSDYRSSGTGVAAQVRLIAQIDPDHKTASIELWVNNVHYHLDASAAPGGAAPVITSVVADLNANDFVALYSLTDQQMHQASQAQYTALGAANGRFSAVHTVGAISYKTSESGLGAAEVAVTATTTHTDGSTHTLNGTIELINTQQGWKLYTINAAT